MTAEGVNLPLKRAGLISLAATATLVFGLGFAPSAASASGVAGAVVSGLRQQQPEIGVPTAPVTFTSDGLGSLPTKYEYWVNDGPHKTVRADKSGTAIAYLIFKTHRNGLSVESIGADGTTGGVTFDWYYASGAAPAASNDANGDGSPDVLLNGSDAGLGSGIWLAAGRASGASTGRLKTPAVNITPNGFFDDGDTSYVDGASIITGNLLGNNLDDVMVYFGDGPKAGIGIVVSGSGDGSPLSGYDGVNLPGGYLSDINGDSPIQLANAYNASNQTFINCDFIGISGSGVNGYRLSYYPLQSDGAFNIAMPELTDNLTPAGGTDWENWRLYSTRTAGGNIWLFLWNRSTGALYLWSGLQYVSNGDYTGHVSYTQYQLSKHWTAGSSASALEASDFTGDGVPDLWAVMPDGTVRAFVVSALAWPAGTGSIDGKAPQALS
jgi:hypothetical protein